MAQLADQAGLSKTACWRRIIKHLEAEGVLARTVALADRAKLGLTIVAFVSVKTANHSAGWTDQFAAVRDMEEVVEFHRLAGDIDYLFKKSSWRISLHMTSSTNRVSRIDLTDVSASFSMEEIKTTTALPIR